MECLAGRQPDDHELAQRAAHALDRDLPRLAPDDELGQ